MLSASQKKESITREGSSSIDGDLSERLLTSNEVNGSMLDDSGTDDQRISITSRDIQLRGASICVLDILNRLETQAPSTHNELGPDNQKAAYDFIESQLRHIDHKAPTSKRKNIVDIRTDELNLAVSQEHSTLTQAIFNKLEAINENNIPEACVKMFAKLQRLKKLDEAGKYCCTTSKPLRPINQCAASTFAISIVTMVMAGYAIYDSYECPQEKQPICLWVEKNKTLTFYETLLAGAFLLLNAMSTVYAFNKINPTPRPASKDFYNQFKLSEGGPQLLTISHYPGNGNDELTDNRKRSGSSDSNDSNRSSEFSDTTSPAYKK